MKFYSANPGVYIIIQLEAVQSAEHSQGRETSQLAYCMRSPNACRNRVFNEKGVIKESGGFVGVANPVIL